MQTLAHPTYIYLFANAIKYKDTLNATRQYNYRMYIIDVTLYFARYPTVVKREWQQEEKD